MNVHLVTFSDDNMTRARALCASSAKQHGCDEEWQYDPKAIRSSWDSYHEVFRQPEDSRRAWGWWAWKPLIILDAMRRAVECYSGPQFIVYADAGIEFIHNINVIIDRMDQDIFLFGNNWEHAHWCKRDIVEEVWPAKYYYEGLGAELGSVDKVDDYDQARTWERFGKQAQASVIFFRVSDYTRAFVKEWLDWCLFEGGRLIDDSPSRAPNHPEFQENRHDQAILTTMAYREGIKLHWWPAMYNGGAFSYEKIDQYKGDNYPIMFHHHRKRNEQFGIAA